MASFFLSPIGNDAPFFLPTGVAASGAKLFTYVAGSTTKQNTYTDNTGNTANANPILLNSSGYPASGGNLVEIWGNTGVTYKFVLAPSTDSDPPSSAYWTRDNIALLNDVSSAVSEWTTGPTPTFVSATSFTLVGDQTGTWTVGRRVRSTNTGGTIYSTILTSAFTSLTTITVVNDSGSLDSGISAVAYGILDATNKSIPPFNEVVALTSVAGTNTITASATRAAQGYITNQVYVFIPLNTTTGAATLNINSQGAKNIFANGAANVARELIAGMPALLEYDGTQFNIIGPTIATGTWTPVLTFATPGDLSVVYAANSQIGTYTKKGREVTVSCRITTSTFTFSNASGILQVTGLPFAARSLTGMSWVGALRWEGITKAGFTNIVARVVTGNSAVQFEASGSAQAATTLATGDLPSAGTVTIDFVLVYEVTS